MPELPLPQRPRWQPLRCGLVDIFYYDDEEFRFRDGNLLLRGNNGTGKSKVLALTLPFLLDAQITPSRVEPDGDPAKRMEWNLLLGGEYPERQGYVWLELARLKDDGEPEFCTLGCGLRAVAGRGAPERWFFVTPQRVRADLHLLDAHRRTLSRDRLLEALGTAGRLFIQPGPYRQAVDETLFQLGAARYQALINLLIQLRQPQLSKRPDEGALSSALTEALPPVDQVVLNDVADAFRNLEAERDELAALIEARRAVGAFLDHYRGYAAVAARRRSADVRKAQSAWDKTSGELAEARADLATAREDEEREQTRQRFLDAKLEQVRRRDQTLREGPGMRDARRLEDARQRVDERERQAAALERDGERLLRDQAEGEARLAERERGARAGAEAVIALSGGWARPAAAARIERAHRAALAALDLPDGGPRRADGDDPRIGEAAAQVEALERRRGTALDHLGGLNRSLEAATRAEESARERWQGAVDEAERLAEALANAEVDLAEQGEALVAAVRRFVEVAAELRVSDPEALLAELDDWCRTLEGVNPVAEALRRAYAGAQQRLALAQGGAEQERAARAAERTVLDEERRRLDAGEVAAPPVPHTRAAEVRRERPGAPLWRLVDFRAEVPAEVRAAVEAALEASGLLDAWVDPEGEVRDPYTWDRLLSPGRPATLALDQVLHAAIDPSDPLAARVAPERVAAVLAAIGWGEQGHEVWIAADGRWRLGPMQGAWAKHEAGYLGAGAREAARRRRLAELAELIADLDGQIAALAETVAGIEARRHVLEREWQSTPDDQPLRAAHQSLGDLMRRAAAQRVEVEHLAEVLRLARTAAGERRRERDEAAVDLDLPVDPAELAEVAEALADYGRQGAGFWPSLRRHWDALARLDETRRALVELAERRAEHQEAADAAARDLRQARETYHTLRDTLGAQVEELQRQLAEVEREIRDFERQRKENEGLLVEAATRVSRLTERELRLAETLAERDQLRRAAVDRLQAFAASGLLRLAAPGVEPLEREGIWPLDPAVRLARAVDKALGEVDDSDPAWQRHQRGLHEHFQTLQQTLSAYGHEAAAEQSEDLILVQVVFQARPCAADELAQALDREVGERRELLDAKERALLEQHLVSEVASHLQGLIGDAERLVAGINRELEARPTSTGMKLRLAWEPLDEGEGLAGLAEAHKRLWRQSALAWSDEDRRALGELLQRRIAAVRESEAGGTLLEHLERALDYRRWYRFRVERWQGGRWRPAYGPASGGERALVVTLPLFAAASSHYSSAGPHAPRLVMLDEAFAGIDDDARAKCLGLMCQFDLDFLLTSEREWGCYPDVPGLAIAQLVRREGIDAVYVSRWAWDGRHRTRDEEPQAVLPPRGEAEEVSRAEPGGDGGQPSLF
jgi:uncharacterized protein (TIGR02680 family)